MVNRLGSPLLHQCIEFLRRPVDEMDRLSFYLLDALFNLDPAVCYVGDDGAVTRHVRAAIHQFEASLRCHVPAT